MGEYIGGDFCVEEIVLSSLTPIGDTVKVVPPGANRIVFTVDVSFGVLADFVLLTGDDPDNMYSRIAGTDWADSTKWSDGPGDYVYPDTLGRTPNELGSGSGGVGKSAVVFTVGPVRYIGFSAQANSTHGPYSKVSVVGRMYRT